MHNAEKYFIPGKLILLLTLLCAFDVVYAQTNLYLKDSTTVSLITKYDEVSIIHRKLFGENYRKEWAAQTKLPVIKISEILGGLKPTELGDGHQSHSLRLEEKSGIE